MLLCTLGASLLGNLLKGKGFVKAVEGTIRAGYVSSIKKKGLVPPRPLTNFEIKNYYENEPRFNDVYSRDNLPKIIKNGACILNLDEYADIGFYTLDCFVCKKW